MPTESPTGPPTDEPFDLGAWIQENRDDGEMIGTEAALVITLSVFCLVIVPVLWACRRKRKKNLQETNPEAPQKREEADVALAAKIPKDLASDFLEACTFGDTRAALAMLNTEPGLIHAR